MDEAEGAQFALQVALQTLKERCQQFQRRISTLEEDNLALHLQVDASQKVTTDSMSEIDRLNAQVSELTEQNHQHRRNNAIVTTENRRLWSQLSKLSAANKSMGDHISTVNKFINDPSSFQPLHTPLIRSKTFTHDDLLHTRLPAKEDKISADLEEISLNEKESLLSESFAFDYHANVLEENRPISPSYFEQNLKDLKSIKNLLLEQNSQLAVTVERVCNTESKCIDCDSKTKQHDNVVQPVDKQAPQKAIQHVSVPSDVSESDQLELDSLANWVTPENSYAFTNMNCEMDRQDNVCPMCLATMNHSTFDEFTAHVSNHFQGD